MRIKITKIYRTDKDKQGNKLMTKDGRYYKKILIKCEEYGDAWLSGIENAITQGWKVGDVVDIVVKEVEINGNIYLNFRALSRLDGLKQRVERLEAEMEELKGQNKMF